MILLANGCSHTAGAEIEYPVQGACYQRAWPKKLAILLNYSSTNLAVSGASDDRVARTTIDCLGKLKNQPNYDPKKIFVAIAWPGLFRTEIFKNSDYEPGFWDDGWMPIVAGNDETYKTQSSPSAYAYYRAWMLRNNIRQETVRFYSNVLLLQNILISNNIKYIFWNASGNVPQDNRGYLNEVYRKRFPFLLDRQRSLTELLHSTGFKHSEFAKYGHYGEDAQEWFADFLFRYITKEKLL